MYRLNSADCFHLFETDDVSFSFKMSTSVIFILPVKTDDFEKEVNTENFQINLISINKVDEFFITC